MTEKKKSEKCKAHLLLRRLFRTLVANSAHPNLVPRAFPSKKIIFKNSSECWLEIGHKNALHYCAQQFLLSSFREFVHDHYCLDHGLSGSCTKEMHVVRKLSV